MGASMALGGAAVALASEAPASPAADQPAAVASSESGVAGTVAADATEGTFSFDQATITPNEVIASTFRGAVGTLCQATEDFAQVNPLEWQLSVTGEVDSEFTATVDELAGEDSVSQVMTCTCGGNPADGRAIITADVKGIPVSHLLDRAGARAGVNTLVFVSSDGCEVALPLSWVVAHHGVISYEINGEDLSASVGGNNQLWLAGAPANYFVRDVAEVRVEAREASEVPAEPGEGAEFPNSPNAGVTSAQ
ncbi:MAG: molybdopterin-dependent oxidoreductase [Coriobacteriia bacterium]|nr:molybdopterin-dependent oxidoreductase [Coriobacteriia bacterium]